MSDVPPGGGMPGGQPGGQAGGQQPSEEEIRAYLGQLRQAPADQVVAEVLSSLLQAAQVKLGRNDARLLIDLTAAAVEAGRDRLPSQLTEQVDQAVTQLRLAQVEAEKEVAQQGEQEPADVGPDAGGDQGQAAEEPTPGQQDPGPAPRQPGSAASRLWIPGR